MSIWRRLNTFRLMLVFLLLAGVAVAFCISSLQGAADKERGELVGRQNAIKYDTLVMMEAVRNIAGSARTPESRETENLARRRLKQAESDLETQVSTLQAQYPQAHFPQLSLTLTDLLDFTTRPTNANSFLGQVRDLIDKNPENALSFFERGHPDAALKRDQYFRDLETQVQGIINAKSQLALIVTVGGTIVLIMILAGSIVVGHLQSSSIAAPLNRLSANLERMRQGDFTHRLDLDQKDEFGEVGQGLDRLADELCELVGQVQRSGLRLTSAAAQISEIARRQQSATQSIADTSVETGETSVEISATSRELVKTIKEVSHVAEQTGQVATTGRTAIAQMEATMRQMMEASAAIAAKLVVLSEKTGSINSVVTTIAKVADQTNLLSLNAAIEAEKAGEYGLGFAVVATEIRRLADQTAVATYDIEKTVKEMESAVLAGVGGMDKFSDHVRSGVEQVRRVGAQLAEIITEIQNLTPRFQAVNEGVQAQSTGAQQISESLAQLTRTAQQTAEALRDSNAAVEELTEAAGRLQASVSRFKLRIQPEPLEPFRAIRGVQELHGSPI